MKTYKLKGLEYYAINCRNSIHALETFIANNCGVTLSNIEEVDGVYNDNAKIFDSIKKLKTMGTNTPTNTVEEAARFQYNNVGYSKEEDGTLGLYINGAIVGANWQKEQDKAKYKALEESHAELFFALNKMYESCKPKRFGVPILETDMTEVGSITCPKEDAVLIMCKAITNAKTLTNEQ
jgi:hypothetical protein